MLFQGILLAAFCCFGSLLIFFCAASFRKGRKRGEPSILELMRQAKLLLAICFFSFLIYTGLFFAPGNKIDILVNQLNAIIEGVGFIWGIIFYFILCFIYLTIYYLIDRSVSARLLEIIDNSQGRKMTLEEIKKVYNVERKYKQELKGMLEGGFITKQLGYYKNSAKGTLYAKMARLMKRLLKLGPGG